jgi:hypothetical protein
MTGSPRRRRRATSARCRCRCPASRTRPGRRATCDRRTDGGTRCVRAPRRCVVATTVPCRPQDCRQARRARFASSSSVRRALRIGATSAYSNSGCRFSAWFAGSVQGVVVQITQKPRPRGSAGRPKAAASAATAVGEREADVDGEVGAVLRIRLRLRPAPSRSRSTSSPASGRGTRSPCVEILPQRAQLVGLVARIHRQVRIIPVAQHAETDEVLLWRAICSVA